jgi:hypothetical protein
MRTTTVLSAVTVLTKMCVLLTVIRLAIAGKIAIRRTTATKKPSLESRHRPSLHGELDQAACSSCWRKKSPSKPKTEVITAPSCLDAVGLHQMKPRTCQLALFPRFLDAVGIHQMTFRTCQLACFLKILSARLSHPPKQRFPSYEQKALRLRTQNPNPCRHFATRTAEELWQLNNAFLSSSLCSSIELSRSPSSLFTYAKIYRCKSTGNAPVCNNNIDYFLYPSNNH